MQNVIEIYSLKVYARKMKNMIILHITHFLDILNYFFLKKSQLGKVRLYFMLHFQTKAVMRLYTVTGRQHLKSQKISKSSITNSSYIL